MTWSANTHRRDSNRLRSCLGEVKSPNSGTGVVNNQHLAAKASKRSSYKGLPEKINRYGKHSQWLADFFAYRARRNTQAAQAMLIGFTMVSLLLIV